MKEAGFERDALYLVRPDGYVALAAPQANVERLRRYFAERGGMLWRTVKLSGSKVAR